MAHVLDLRDGVDPLRELTGRYLDLIARPDRDERPFGGYFISSDSEFAPLGRFVERAVFGSRFGNDGAAMDSEYDPYEDASYFSVIIDHQLLEPVGVIRRICPNPYGLKTLNDMRTIPGWDVSLDEIRAHHGDVRLETTADVATLAVRREWSAVRGGIVSAGVYHTMYLGCLMADYKFEVFALDTRVAETPLMKEVAFKRICDLPAREYLGSPSTAPYIADVEAGLRLAKRGGPIGRMLAFGEGLEEHFSFPPADLTVDGPIDPTNLEPQGERVGTGANV